MDCKKYDLLFLKKIEFYFKSFYLITDDSWEGLKPKSLRQCQLNLQMRERSKNTKTDLALVTLPVAKITTSPFMYMGWIDALSENLDFPVLMVRGNQEDVMTFYS